MKPNKALLESAAYSLGLAAFYFKYVPLVGPFQVILIPILLATTVITAVSLTRGTLLFIFLVPLINNLPYFFGLDEPIPLAPTALVLFLFYFMGVLGNRTLNPPLSGQKDPIGKPLLVFSFLVIVSALITFWRYTNFFPLLSDSIYELKTNAFGVTAGGALMSTIFNALNYLTGMALFIIIAKNPWPKGYVKKIIVVLCFSSLLACGFGLFQHFHDPKIGNNAISISGSLINGTFKDALSFGAFLSMLVPVLLGTLLCFRGRLRILASLLILLSGSLIFLVGSKSGLLAVVASAVLFSILAVGVGIGRYKAKPVSLAKLHPRTYLLAAGAILLIIGLLTFDRPLIKKISNSTTVSRLSTSLQLKTLEEIFSGRADTLWNMAVRMIEDYPLAGVGIGGYIIESSNYAAVAKTEIGTPESAENYFLQVGAELGWIGLALILWILWEILKRIFRGYKKIPVNDPRRFLFIGASCGIFSFILDTQVHSYIGSYEIVYIFWLLVGLVFLLGSKDPEDGSPKPAENQKPDLPRTAIFSRKFIIATAVVIFVSGSTLLWNSTHSLSLARRTKELNLPREFGLDKLEKTADGREFRWTREYGGIPVKLEKSVLSIPIHASHPDIRKKPVQVKFYLVKDFFKHKTFLKEITLARNEWQDVVLSVSQEDIGQEAILLLKINRTWNPLKTKGVPDARNLGVAVGKIEFKD
jgi:hypothetical protein